MDRSQICEEMVEIMEDVFDAEDVEYSDSLSADDIEEWDSLSNIRFVVAVEKAFGVRMSNSEIADLDNVGALVDLLLEKQASA